MKIVHSSKFVEVAKWRGQWLCSVTRYHRHLSIEVGPYSVYLRWCA